MIIYVALLPVLRSHHIVRHVLAAQFYTKTFLLFSAWPFMRHATLILWILKALVCASGFIKRITYIFPVWAPTMTRCHLLAFSVANSLISGPLRAIVTIFLATSLIFWESVKLLASHRLQQVVSKCSILPQWVHCVSFQILTAASGFSVVSLQENGVSSFHFYLRPYPSSSLFIFDFSGNQWNLNCFVRELTFFIFRFTNSASVYTRTNGFRSNCADSACP